MGKEDKVLDPASDLGIFDNLDNGRVDAAKGASSGGGGSIGQGIAKVAGESGRDEGRRSESSSRGDSGRKEGGKEERDVSRGDRHEDRRDPSK